MYKVFLIKKLLILFSKKLRTEFFKYLYNLLYRKKISNTNIINKIYYI